MKYGLRHTYHQLTPNIVNATNGEVDFVSNLKKKYAHEAEIYVSDDWKFNSGLSLNYGIRLSAFVFMGPYFSSSRNINFSKGQVVKTYFVPEPRIVFNKNWMQILPKRWIHDCKSVFAFGKQFRKHFAY